MTWDPAATQGFVMVGLLIGVVVFLLIVKSRQPEAPPNEVAFSRAAWGTVLHEGEEIEMQVPALKPYGWLLRQILKGNRLIGPSADAQQLAWTSRGALLLADSEPGDLSGRRRYERGTFRFENLKDDGKYCVSLRLALPPKKAIKLSRVPRAFVDRLRAKGLEIQGE